MRVNQDPGPTSQIILDPDQALKFDPRRPVILLELSMEPYLLSTGSLKTFKHKTENGNGKFLYVKNIKTGSGSGSSQSEMRSESDLIIIGSTGLLSGQEGVDGNERGEDMERDVR
jgi:hypothetical protein